MNKNPKPDVINGSTVKIWMDETSQQITMTLKAKIISAYQGLPDAVKKQGKINIRLTLLVNTLTGLSTSNQPKTKVLGLY